VIRKRLLAINSAARAVVGQEPKNRQIASESRLQERQLRLDGGVYLKSSHKAFASQPAAPINWSGAVSVAYPRSSESVVDAKHRDAEQTTVCDLR